MLDLAVWRRRALPLGRGALLADAAIAAAGGGLIAWSALGDHGARWVLGASVLATIQVGTAARVTLAEHPWTDA